MKKPLAKTVLSLLLIAVLGGTYIVVKHPFDRIWKDEDGEEEKDAGVEGQMMLLWQSRAYPDPSNMEGKYMQAWEYAQQKRREALNIKQDLGVSGAPSTLSYTGSWTSIGPNTGIGGRILSIAVNPVRGNSVYVGSASGGVWKTYNAQAASASAVTWQSVTTGYPVLGVTSIIINPSDTNTIFVGTGEVYRIDSTGTTPNPGNTGANTWKTRGTYGVGILKSADGGNTWAQVLIKSESALFGIQRLRFDPTNSNTVYAAATDGLYRSTNSGLTWTRILAKTYISDVVINSANNQQIVIGVGNLQNTDKGIYQSTDGGATWTQITSGLPASFQGYIKFDNVTSAGNQNTIIASIGVNETGTAKELYISTNFGTSWTAKSNSTHSLWQFWCAHNIAINPSNTNSLIFAGVNLFSYNVSGSSSSSVSIGHQDIHDIRFDPSNSNYVYLACDGGMFRSTNAGSAFSAINTGLGATQFYSTIGVAKSAASSTLVVGGLQDNGMMSYNGTSWTTLPHGSDGAAAFFDPTNDNIYISSNDARDVYLNGTNILAYWGEVHDSRTAFVAPLAISKSSHTTFYVGTDELFKSTNSGGTWVGGTSNGANPGTNYIDAIHKTAIALAVSPTNANKVYVSTSPFAQYDGDVDNLYSNPPPNVQRTTNGATPFTKVNGTGANILPNRYTMHFAISPTFDDSVWAVIGGFGSAHVYVTPDGGANWYSKDPGPSGGGLPDVPTNAIMIDPNNSKIIYVGNDLGVYVSPDGGTTWQDFNSGFWDATLIMDLEPYPGNKILAATHGKGAFTSQLYSIALPVTLTSFSGYRNNAVDVLQWNVSTEVNMLQYELERSTNGTDFSKVAVIPAHNVNNSNYSYQDNIANIQNTTTTVFYRLKIVNSDENFVYSNIVNIGLDLQPAFTISGNPFGSQLMMTFTTSAQQPAEAKLLDASGRLMAIKHYTLQSGNNTLNMSNLGSLANGVYLLEFITRDARITRKVVKK